MGENHKLHESLPPRNTCVTDPGAKHISLTQTSEQNVLKTVFLLLVH
jgi:hypothetical protein